MQVPRLSQERKKVSARIAITKSSRRTKMIDWHELLDPGLVDPEEELGEALVNAAAPVAVPVAFSGANAGVDPVAVPFGASASAKLHVWPSTTTADDCGSIDSVRVPTTTAEPPGARETMVPKTVMAGPPATSVCEPTISSGA